MLQNVLKPGFQEELFSLLNADVLWFSQVLHMSEVTGVFGSHKSSKCCLFFFWHFMFVGEVSPSTNIVCSDSEPFLSSEK